MSAASPLIAPRDHTQESHYGKGVGDHDLFGNAVNLASKLGEDVAGPGEILATQEAMENIPPNSGIRGRSMEVSIAGLELRAFAVQYQ